MTDILMPALSPTMEEGSLAKWLVKVGDKVRSGDVIAEIETDKATMEVEAVDEGVIDEIVVAAGTEGVKVGALIAVLLAEGEERGAAKPAPAAAPAAPKAEAAPAPAAAPAAKAASGDQGLAPSVRRIAAEEGLDVASVAGTGRGGRVTKGDALAALSGGGSVARSSGDRVVASPYARKLAGQKGFTLGDIPGTVQFKSQGGNTLNTTFLKPVPITKDNLNVVIDAGWITKAEVCQNVPAGKVAVCK